MSALSSPFASDESTTAAELPGRIAAAHHACVTALRDALNHAATAGYLLLESKSQHEPDGWNQWLADNCPGVARDADWLIHTACQWDSRRNDMLHEGSLTIGAALKQIGPCVRRPRRLSPPGFVRLLDMEAEQRHEIAATDVYQRSVYIFLLHGAGWTDQRIADFFGMDGWAVQDVRQPETPQRFTTQADFDLLAGWPVTIAETYSGVVCRYVSQAIAEICDAAIRRAELEELPHAAPRLCSLHRWHKSYAESSSPFFAPPETAGPDSNAAATALFILARMDAQHALGYTAGLPAGFGADWQADFLPFLEREKLRHTLDALQKAKMQNELEAAKRMSSVEDKGAAYQALADWVQPNQLAAAAIRHEIGLPTG